VKGKSGQEEYSKQSLQRRQWQRIAALYVLLFFSFPSHAMPRSLHKYACTITQGKKDLERSQ